MGDDDNVDPNTRRRDNEARSLQMIFTSRRNHPDYRCHKIPNERFFIYISYPIIAEGQAHANQRGLNGTF